MKSCLKTPPLTPCASATATPSGSGRASPTHSESGSCERPLLRKTVSFCDEELEEVYFADEWDRSPAPVTPKLSYQDVLELKQLRLSLPRAPPPPTYREPFTTSTPGPSTHTPYPLSRLAAQPSLTPSRWKNRSQNTSCDPEILPYLDAVPIRLLPLLDSQEDAAPMSQPQTVSQPDNQSQSGSQHQTRPEPAMSTPALSPRPENPKSAAQPPTPHSPPTPPLTPPTSSPSMPAKALSNSEPQSSAPPPPIIEVRSPSGTTSAPAPPSPPTPTRRRLSFSFVPLLPVESAPVVPDEKPVAQPQPTPGRKFNMNFVPLVAPPSPTPEQQPPSSAQSATSAEKAATLIPDAVQTEPIAQVSESLASSSPGSRPRTITLPPSVSECRETRTYPRTPAPTASWSTAASDTDTEPEGETDRDTETETETESIGTSASSLPSPPCAPRSEDCCPEGVDALRLDEHPREGGDVDSGLAEGYFPYMSALAIHTQMQMRIRSSAPGATPPLDALFPGSPTSPTSPASVAHAALTSSASGTTLASSTSGTTLATSTSSSTTTTLVAPNEMSLRRLASAALLSSPALRGLPSPALAPPSPLSLDAPGLVSSLPLGLGITDAEGENVAQAQVAKRAFVQARTQMRVAVCARAEGSESEGEPSVLGPSLRRTGTVRAGQ
ncbi:hypothetical protein CERSUDRAFT_112689 [Gelatoporia subvermispora B]|uniref:Uncharacterized protein n=1 Tax=Ceriporiopsis subvermispora (strain B) TaxID=914234 RepID=M2RJL5_CERS8|nr:hypothetical protein CERSUDRAFT_112689 [Gelatoporia subvermispora B]